MRESSDCRATSASCRPTVIEAGAAGSPAVARRNAMIATPLSRRPPQTRALARPSPLTPLVAHPRLWRLIGQPAVAGAIGAAGRRLQAAIGEILAERIAERPSAVDFADFREPDPLHLANFRLGENPTRLPRFAGEGRDEGLPAGERLRARVGRRPRPPRAPRRRGARAAPAPAPVELDSDPVRLADHGGARRRAERLGDRPRASSLERQRLENLDRLLCP